MEEEIVLSESQQWKAVMHPLRLAILKTLGGQELTNQELANELGVAAGKLHFHTKKLLAAGLIELAGTRADGPRTEKLYRRKLNSNFRIPAVEDGSAPPVRQFIENALAMYEQTWMDFGERGFLQYGFHQVYYISPKTFEELKEGVLTLMHKIQDDAVPEIQEDTKCVSLSALLYEIPEKHEK